MSEMILIAEGKTMAAIPRQEWEGELREVPRAMQTRLAFMTADHHRVRRFVVAELPRRGRAIPLDEIATALALTPARTEEIVAELERALFFIVRTDGRRFRGRFP